MNDNLESGSVIVALDIIHTYYENPFFVLPFFFLTNATHTCPSMKIFCAIKLPFIMTWKHLMAPLLLFLFSKMELLIVQGTKQQTRDRTAVMRKLVANSKLLTVSISYDGGKKYDKVLTCGIPTTDFSQHKMFVLKLNIEDECPHDPCQLSFVDLCLLAREYMLSQGVELTTATCDAFLGTAHQKDIAKPNEADPKYRAVLNVVKSEKL